MNKTLGIAGALSSLLLTCATAASAAAPTGLKALDANGDGAISRQEALAGQVQTFKQRDTNDDDHLSAEEWRATSAQQAHPGRSRHAIARARRRVFNNLDTDDDDRVSLQEYQAAMTPYFDRLDSDGDGVLDTAELNDAIEPPERKTP